MSFCVVICKRLINRNSIMDTGKLGIVENVDCTDFNIFNEASHINAVKYNPREIDIFTKCRSNLNSTSSGCEMGQEQVDGSYQDLNEEKLDLKNLNPRDLHSKFVDNSQKRTCNTEEIKSDIDIVYEDIKRETGEEKSIELDEIRFCEVCYPSFDKETGIFESTSNRSQCSCLKPNESLFYNIQGQDMSCDVKLSFHDLTTDLGLQPLEVQDEKISEVTKKQDSSAISQRLSKPSIKIDNKKKSKLCSEPLENDVSLAEKKFCCKSCSKSFSWMNHLKDHERGHTGENPFLCNICSKLFSHKSTLKAHMRVHTGEKPFLCRICSKSFYRQDHLKSHERSHTGKKPYQCKICSKSFRGKYTLKIHERSHTGEKPFLCQICSKSFRVRNTLKIHERNHTGENPFLCQICSKSFYQKGHLRSHERIHTGEKPFQCKICSKSFSLKYTLKIHERSHTGEKPYLCQICSKSFYQNGHLRSHERIHTGEKPFQCKICSKSFNQKSTLRTHGRTHTGEKPFQCKI